MFDKEAVEYWWTEVGKSSVNIVVLPCLVDAIVSWICLFLLSLYVLYEDFVCLGDRDGGIGLVKIDGEFSTLLSKTFLSSMVRFIV